MKVIPFLILTAHLWLALAPVHSAATPDLQGNASATTGLRYGKAPRFINGQTVCFLGDSITQGALYQAGIEFFYATRYPELNVTFWNCGISGDTAQSILSLEGYRLQVDVLGHHPDIVTLMLGMNDVNRPLYYPNDQANSGQLAEKREQAIQKAQENMGKLVEKIEQGGAKVVFITPTPYEESEEVTGDNSAPLKGVNAALSSIAQWVRNQAAQCQAGWVDFHAELMAVNQSNQVKQRDWSILKLGRTSGLDRVHPYMPCHWAMAFIFLKAQGHSPLVNEIEIDAQTSKPNKAERVVVEQLQATPKGVSFRALSQSLPLAIPPNGAAILEVIPFNQELNQEILRVQGLAVGEYELRIDQAIVGSYSSQQLAVGVNLGANPSTPQYQQSLQVYKVLEQRQQLCGKLRGVAATRYALAKTQKIDPTDDAVVERELQAKIDQNKDKGETVLAPLRRQFEAVKSEATTQEQYKVLGQQMREVARPVAHSYSLTALSHSPH